jgi:P450-derived glycosyltransferase activator
VIEQRESDQRALRPAELGLRLQLIQGAQWLCAINDDPYARVLRGFEDDPHPLYERLRHTGPLVASSVGGWVTVDHERAAELLAHPELDPVHAGSPRSPLRVVPLAEDIVHATPPAIDRLGELATAAFERAVDGVSGEVDLITGFAARVPADVLAETFGLPTSWLAERVANTSIAADASLCPQRLAATRGMLGAIGELRERLADPGAVLLTVLGAQVATTLLGNAVHALLGGQGHWAKLAADPARAPQVIDETLRHDSPIQAHALIARTGLEFAGTEVAAGEQVVVLIGGANRDPAVYADPARFEPDRVAGPLLPGAPYGKVLPFARAVAEAVLPMLVTRFPALRRTGLALRRRRAPVTRTLVRLPASADSREEAR